MSCVQKFKDDIEMLRIAKEAMVNGILGKEEYETWFKTTFLEKIKKTQQYQTGKSAPTTSVGESKTQTGSKLYMIVKPEQAGKTKEVLMRMVGAFKGGDTISIIFCDNSLLQVSQTKDRAGKEDGLGKICEISSSKDANAKNAAELCDLFWENEEGYSTIACCAHSVQIHQNINGFLTKMAKRTPNQKFEIYFDEASKVAIAPKMVKRVHEWERLPNIEKIYFIDATPESREGGILSVYADDELIRLCCPTSELSENYIGVADFNHIECEALPGENSVGYAERILNADPLKSGDYAFIPSSFKRDSHYDMRDMLIAKGAVVVVLNGEHKGISCKYASDDKVTTLDFDKSAMQTDSIVDIIEREAWSVAKRLNKPLVITGGLVPGRGLSFQTEGMLFTRGIFGPNIATTAIASSQKYGRIKGNIRHLSGYAPCKVHSSKKFHKECVVQEKFARWLQVEASKGSEGDETTMNKKKAQQELTRMSVEIGLQKEARGEPTIKKFYGEEGQNEVKQWFAENLSSILGGKGPRKTKLNADGYYVRPLGKDDKRKDVCSVERLYKFRKWNQDAKPTSTHPYTWFPCYEDVNDKSTLQWWLIWYPPIEE